MSTVEEARQVLNQLPPAILWRIWILYRADLPDDRYYTSRGLYEAPDPKAHKKRLTEEEQKVEAVTDKATQQLERQFGAKELREAKSVESQILADAKRRGSLVRAKGD